MARILVVDDTPGSRGPVSRLLRLEGHETACAVDGHDALAEMDRFKPDLVLLDIMMPNMDGLRFLEIIRTKSNKRQVPVILMTALDDSRTMQQAQRLGVQGYLVKARFTIGEMLERIEQALNGQAGWRPYPEAHGGSGYQGL